MGNEHPNIVPYQTFTAADGDFVLAVGNDRQFTRLCEIIERPDLVTDERFVTNPARVANRKVLVAILGGTFVQRSVDNWIEPLLQAGIPAGPINNIAQIVADPHIVERGSGARNRAT